MNRMTREKGIGRLIRLAAVTLMIVSTLGAGTGLAPAGAASAAGLTAPRNARPLEASRPAAIAPAAHPNVAYCPTATESGPTRTPGGATNTPTNCTIAVTDTPTDMPTATPTGTATNTATPTGTSTSTTAPTNTSTGTATAVPLAPCSEASSSSLFYKYDIIAKTGDTTLDGRPLTSLGHYPWVNNKGAVAYIAGGQIGTASKRKGVMACDAQSGRRYVSPGLVGSSRTFGNLAQINDSNKVVAYDFSGGSSPEYLMRTYDSVPPIGPNYQGTTLAAGPNYAVQPYDPQDAHLDAVGVYPSINNNGQVAFSAQKYDKSGPKYYLVTGDPSGNLSDPFVGNPVGITTAYTRYYGSGQPSQTGSADGKFDDYPNPQIADDGHIVVKAGTRDQNLTAATPIPVADPIRLYPYDLGTYRDIACTYGSNCEQQGFTKLGLRPGISNDGSIVVFEGDRGNGPGIFASIEETPGVTDTLVRIAGENGATNNSPQPDLGTDDLGNPIYFNSFEPRAKVSVSHQQLGEPGLSNDSFTVSFIATPNTSSPSQLFSAKKGIFTVTFTISKDFLGSTLHYNPTQASPVVQIGDTIGGQTVTDLGDSNGPLSGIALGNRQSDDSGAARTVSQGDHQLMFWVGTSSGEMIVRATSLYNFAAKPTPTPTDTGTPGPIVITKVKPQYTFNGAFIHDVTLRNKVDVSVAWHGHNPDHISFTLNGHTLPEPATGSGGSHTYDMGTDLLDGPNTLEIVAYDDNGVASQPVSFVICGLKIPAWLRYLTQQNYIGPFQFDGAKGVYTASVKWVFGVWKVPALNSVFKGSSVEFSLKGTATLTLGDPATFKITGELAAEGKKNPHLCN